jgi:anti-anti-sigma factor
VLKLDWAIYAGVAVSLVLYIRKATRLDLKEYIVDETGQLKQITDYEDRIEPDLAFIDVNGETFFGSADQIKERIEKICTESDDIKVIILRMKNAMNLDITGAMVLKDIAQMLKERKKTLMVSGATPQIREVLQEAGVAEVIGQDKILVAQKSLLASSRQAIDRARAHIDSVLEGSTSREEEEDHPTQHTLERLEEVVEEPEEELQETSENPVEEEKVQPPSDEELSDEQEDESSEENDRENES